MAIEGDYFYEDYTAGAGIRYRIDRLVYQGRTAFQDVLIFDNAFAGRMAVLDGVVQVTTMDEFIYHEMLTHTPILALGDATRVLIIGGGDGGMLRRALMHPNARATMIDIDGEFVELCREHLPMISAGAFENPRATYLAGDGAAFVRDSDETFDVIIVDSTDPHDGPGEVLYSTEFYRHCKARLRPGGILVGQTGVPQHEPHRLKALRATLGQVFADLTVNLATVPTYFGGTFAFAWASDDPAARQVPVETLARRFAASGIETRYYTPEVHVASFALPRFVRDALEG